MKIQNAVLLSTIFLTACGGGGSDAVTPEGTVRVAVQTADGSPVADVSVALSGDNATTNSMGIAEFTMDEFETAVATLNKSGFMGQQITVSAPEGDGTSTFPATIKEMVLAGNDVDYSGAATTPVTVEGTDGASVTISDNNAFVDSDGNPYTGLVDVYITPVNITDDADGAAFPGEFSGIAATGGAASDEGDDGEEIVSYGMADYTFTDQEGDELELSEGVHATIDIPIFQTDAIAGHAAPAAGQNIKAWYYDYEKSSWIENELGEGTVTEVTVGGETKLVLRSEVPHFTPWNCDAFINSIARLTTNVYCPGVNDVSACTATVNLSAAGGSFRRSYPVTSTGTNKTVQIPAGTACATVSNVCCPSGSVSGYTQQCATIGVGGTGTLTFRPPAE